MVEKGLLQRLRDVLDKPFATVSYTEAVKLLKQSGKEFEFPVEWGTDLQSEHERWGVGRVGAGVMRGRVAEGGMAPTRVGVVGARSGEGRTRLLLSRAHGTLMLA